MSHGYWLKNTARLAGGALLVGSVSFALGGTATADVSALHGDHKGNNGSIKVHESTTDEWLKKNEPHVCEFYLVGNGFDSAQEVSWKAIEWKPTGDNKTVAKEGTLVLDENGHGRTDDIGLTDGHYKVTWEFEGKPQLKGKKHKVLWVDCEDDDTTPPPDDGESTPPPDDGESTPPPGNGETPPPDDGESTSPPDDGTTPPDDGETPPPDDNTTPEPDDGSQTPDADDAAPPADDGSEGGLPVTGVALTGLVAAGIAAVAGGGTAVYLGRKKKAADADE